MREQPSTRPASTQPAVAAPKPDLKNLGNTSRTSEIIGRELRNSAGDTLGKIHELVIDDEDGRIAYALVAVDMATPSTPGGTPAKLWIIPWELLRAPRVVSSNGATGQNGEPRQVRYLFDFDRERIATAPGFSTSRWPKMDRTYGREVYAFYGRAPYWERQRRLDAGLEEAARADEDPRRRPTAEDPNRTARDVPPLEKDNLKELDPFPVGMFEARNIKTLNGTVTSVIEQTGSENDFGVGIRLLLKRDDQQPKDQDLLVFVGPTEFVKRQGFNFKQNDVVSLKGAEMDRDGRRVFVPLEVTMGDRTMLLRRENGLPAWKRRAKLSGEN
jgi:sporulation protein YlmC with PRC-barrel domain